MLQPPQCSRHVASLGSRLWWREVAGLVPGSRGSTRGSGQEWGSLDETQLSHYHRPTDRQALRSRHLTPGCVPRAVLWLCTNRRQGNQPKPH